jgi:hypothetical protein
MIAIGHKYPYNYGAGGGEFPKNGTGRKELHD